MELVVLVVLVVWGIGILAHIFENGIKDGLFRLVLLALGWVVIYWLATNGSWTLTDFGRE
jgi:hypothetical protein